MLNATIKNALRFRLLTIVLAIALLVVALWLPGADRFEKRLRPDRDGRLPPM